MTGSNTESILKIKEAFSSLKAKNINSIQKIIKGHNKPKLHINMITKGPLRKQVIILMNNTNKKSFIDEISSYIINMNRALKNIKIDIIVDFV